MLSAMHDIVYLIHLRTPGGRCYFYPYLKAGDTETQI